jgi:very-short-patch-repair endonuclease/uncharacterized protein YerC
MAKVKYDWVAIKKFHEEGHSWKEIREKFGCSFAALSRSIKYGRLNKTPKDQKYQKHVRFRKFEWDEIKKFQQEGNSWRDICKKFGCSMSTLSVALKRGDIISVNKSDAARIDQRKKPRKLSEDTKLKLSKARIKFLKDNPDKCPYLLCNPKNGMSYPEDYFFNFFEKEKIDLKYHKQLSIYQLDFYNEEKRICLEIDGEFHYTKEKTIKSDSRKEIYLKENGWRLFRVRWSSYCRLFFKEKHLLIEKIKSLLILPAEKLDMLTMELTDEFIKREIDGTYLKEII